MSRTREERMAEETRYASLKDALEAAVRAMRADEDDMAVFKEAQGKWVTVHIRNMEIAVQLGYTLVVGLEWVLEISESEKDVLSALKELQDEDALNDENRKEEQRLFYIE